MLRSLVQLPSCTHCHSNAYCRKAWVASKNPKVNNTIIVIVLFFNMERENERGGGGGGGCGGIRKWERKQKRNDTTYVISFEEIPTVGVSSHRHMEG